MSHKQSILLIVALFFALGALGLSAQSGASNPWAIACLVLAAALSAVALLGSGR